MFGKSEKKTAICCLGCSQGGTVLKRINLTLEIIIRIYDTVITNSLPLVLAKRFDPLNSAPSPDGLNAEMV